MAETFVCSAHHHVFQGNDILVGVVIMANDVVDKKPLARYLIHCRLPSELFNSNARHQHGLREHRLKECDAAIVGAVDESVREGTAGAYSGLVGRTQ